MNLTAAAVVAQTISFLALITATAWYVVPWMRRRPLAVAVVPLLWVHAFRHVAMQVFSARRFGFAIPLSLAREIAWGDLAGALLALGCLYLLHYRSRWARPLLWVFVVETVLDLTSATIQGIEHKAFHTATGVTWAILNFYVPLLWVTVTLVAWRLAVPSEAGDWLPEPVDDRSEPSAVP